MPRILRERVYFDLREAAAQMGVSLGIMTRWAREGEQHLNDAIETYRDGDKLFVSQSSLKRAVRSELRSVLPPNAHLPAEEREPSLTKFWSCFLSYSTMDQEFADRLFQDLQMQGVECWFAPHHVRAGRKLHEQIDEAIRVHDKLLLILSPHSMASEWVKTEISKARNREVREKARVLFPIILAPFESIRDWECFDADTGKDSAREIREYYIPDFSNWKDHDSYQEAFERLLRDLRATASRSGN